MIKKLWLGSICLGVGLLSSYQAQAKTVEKVVPEIEHIAYDQGTYAISLKADDQVVSAVVATWSQENGQDDLVWTSLSQQSDHSWQVPIDLSAHQHLAGHYHNHVYVTYQDGHQEGYQLKPITFQMTAPLVNQTPQGFEVSQKVRLPRSTIKTAVWSEDAGQDDLQWSEGENGSVLAPYAGHRQYGKYYIHTYVTDAEHQTIGYAQSQQVSTPEVIKTITKQSETHYQIKLSQVPHHIKKLYVPTWSQEGGQDDLKWYQAEQVDPETYQVTIPLKAHHFSSDTFMSHIYAVSDFQSDLHPIGQLSFQTDPVGTYTTPDVHSIVSQDDPSALSVRVLGNERSKLIASVDLAVWSQDQQENLHWYHQDAVDDKANLTTDLAYHGDQDGRYHAHAYLTYQDGIKEGIVLADNDLHHKEVVMSPQPSPHITTYMSEVNTYPSGQCTWGVKTLAPWIPNYMGNANQWLMSARAKGFRTGSDPQVGAIAVWVNDGGGYGHVAYVSEMASKDQIKVKEANYLGNPMISDYRGWFNPKAATWGGEVAYIYPN